MGGALGGEEVAGQAAQLLVEKRRHLVECPLIPVAKTYEKRRQIPVRRQDFGPQNKHSTGIMTRNRGNYCVYFGAGRIGGRHSPLLRITPRRRLTISTRDAL